MRHTPLGFPSLKAGRLSEPTPQVPAGIVESRKPCWHETGLHLGASLGHVGGHLGIVLGCPWAVLRSSIAVLGDVVAI